MPCRSARPVAIEYSSTASGESTCSQSGMDMAAHHQAPDPSRSAQDALKITENDLCAALGAPWRLGRGEEFRKSGQGRVLILRVCPISHDLRPKRRRRIMTAAAQRKVFAEARVASGPFQRRRLRLIQAKKRSTTQRRGGTAKPICPGGLRTIPTSMLVASAGRSPA